MKTYKWGVLIAGVVFGILTIAFPAKTGEADREQVKLIAANSQLSGLAAGAVFPFLDTSPEIKSHVGDAVRRCA